MNRSPRWHYGPFPRVYVGPLDIEKIKQIVENKKVLIVTSKSFLDSETLNKILTTVTFLKSQVVLVSPNPTWIDINRHKSNLGDFIPDVILALGGGSALDTAKILSIAMNTESELADVGTGSKIAFETRTIPLILIPTTAGTGAEITPFATIWTDDGSGKTSIETIEMIPDFIFLDATLLSTLSPEQLLYPGLDAVSHAIETLWNKYQTPVSSQWAKQSLELSVKCLPLILDGNRATETLTDMLLASNMAGIAISDSHTAIAHSISYPITSKYGVPHGLACSFTIPSICHQLLIEECVLIPESDLVKQAGVMLRNLRLPQLVENYMSLEQCLDLIPLMNTKSRAGNYVGRVDESSLESLIQASFRI